MKNILILGGNTINKGAQSMLYVTIDELRKRWPDSTIYFGTVQELESIHGIKAVPVCSDPDAVEIALSRKSPYTVSFQRRIKEVVKKVIGIKNDYKMNCSASNLASLRDCLNSIDLALDISGFALADKWGIQESLNYLNLIKLMKEHEIPIYLMPQSFGPFDYGSQQEFMDKEISEVLRYPEKIYTREIDGFNLLKNNYKLNNLENSYDLVLQNKQLNLSNILEETSNSNNFPKIDPESSVAIIPNYQCETKNKSCNILDLYENILDSLLEKGLKVYVLPHSIQDKNLAQRIKNIKQNNPQIVLINEDFSCLEFDELLKKFKFVVSSRYHGVVHSYKNGIPCLILGWAIKYQELARALDQSRFVFNLDMCTEDYSSILNAIDYLNTNSSSISKQIINNLEVIQNNNCFKFLDDLK